MSLRVEKIENGRAGAADVEKTCRRRGEPEFHHKEGSLTSVQSSAPPMRHQRGFSLVELLFALLVLTIVITTTLAMFVERARRLQQATEIILAYQALSNEAEVRRRLDFNNLEMGGNNFFTDTTLLDPLSPYLTTIEVTTKKPGVKRVVMKILWKKGKREAALTLVRVDTGGTNLW